MHQIQSTITAKLHNSNTSSIASTTVVGTDKAELPDFIGATTYARNLSQVIGHIPTYNH